MLVMIIYWWFQQDDPSISNSFSTICLTLGIYPSKIRNEIFNYYNKKSKKQFLKSFDKFIVQYKEKFSVSNNLNNLRFKKNVDPNVYIKKGNLK